MTVKELKELLSQYEQEEVCNLVGDQVKEVKEIETKNGVKVQII